MVEQTKSKRFQTEGIKYHLGGDIASHLGSFIQLTESFNNLHSK